MGRLWGAAEGLEVRRCKEAPPPEKGVRTADRGELRGVAVRWKLAATALMRT